MIRFETKQNDLQLIPNEVIAYWLPTVLLNELKNKTLEDLCIAKAGVVTGNDPYFLRLWYEVQDEDISFVGRAEYAKYHIFQKGGSYRKWYGNGEYVVKLKDLYNENKTNVSVRRGDKEFYFKKGIGWSQVGGNDKSFRVIENSVCGTATPTIYTNELFNYILAFLNTKIALILLTAFNPTINTLSTDICNLPFKENADTRVSDFVDVNIRVSKIDWDSFETSWDFKKHPLI